MTAVWMWARADLRVRWRSWVVLGLLAGVTFGLAAAGVAGARRTERALPRALAASPRLDAAVLPNDPEFDADKRAEVAALSEVEDAYAFVVPFFLKFAEPRGVGAQLVPSTPAAARAMSGVVLDGRLPNSNRQEIVIDENIRDRHDLDLGSTMVIEQEVLPEVVEQFPPGFLPEDVDLDFREAVKVVGIVKAFNDDEETAATSSAFFDKYSDQIVGPTNMFVTLRGGEARFEEFQRHVQEIMGRPVNVERGSDLLGLRQVDNIADIERSGLLLFALAALLGGAVLVGQALVRAITAGAADAPTWQALGANRSTLVRGMVLPTFVVGIVGAFTSILVGVLLSPQFPLGTTRRYDLDLGVHADWPVLVLAGITLIVSVFLSSTLTAWLRTGPAKEGAEKPSAVGDWAARAGLPPALVTGARLAVEPGRGRRAVPVRSALIGAIAGVVGVVACFTFRAGIDDALAQPRRSGIVWDSSIASFSGPIDAATVARIVDAPITRAVTEAKWIRAIDVAGVSTPTFGTDTTKGEMDFVVLRGRAPQDLDEIAFAPSTLRALGLRVGDEVRVGGAGGTRATVVGAALLPETSHTAYDQSAWMTVEAVDAQLAVNPPAGPEDVSGYVLVRWRPGAQAAGDQLLGKLAGDAYFTEPASLPGAVIELGRMRSLPFVLAVFFALLAVATVAHALVTTVRRRRHDLAIMRSFGFTARQSRVAIAWQATLLAVAGVVVGVPVGILLGRAVWRTLANNFPVDYVPPVAIVVVLLVVPAAVLVVNAIAVLPGRAAARIRPAEALRVE